MSSGHSWGSSEEGSSHTLHEPRVWSDLTLCPWLSTLPPYWTIRRAVIPPSTPTPRGDMDERRWTGGQAAGLTWDPGGRQSHTASFGQQGLGHWDAEATSPTLPAWTVGGHGLSPGQSPPSHCLPKAGIRDPELLPLALHTRVPCSPSMNLHLGNCSHVGRLLRVQEHSSY